MQTPWTLAPHTSLATLYALLEADLEVYKVQLGETLPGMQVEIKPEPLVRGFGWRWLIPDRLLQQVAS